MAYLSSSSQPKDHKCKKKRFNKDENTSYSSERSFVVYLNEIVQRSLKFVVIFWQEKYVCCSWDEGLFWTHADSLSFWILNSLESNSLIAVA